MSATITRERPDTLDSINLITELEAHLEPLYPPESRHGFNVDKLLAEAVAFSCCAQTGRLRVVAASNWWATSMARSSGCMCVHNFVD